MRDELLDVVNASGILPANQDAEHAAVVVICALLLRLTRGEAMEFVSRLPDDVSPLLRGCAEEREEQPYKASPEEFYQAIAEELKIPRDQAERLSHMIFREVKRWIPPKEAKHIEGQLPTNLKDTWRAA